jgi:diaminopimelate epimerase
MELFNSDGSRAEMSGNGISCLAYALVESGGAPGPDVRIATDAGPRVVHLDGDRATVAMGEAVVKPGDEGLLVDVGNPHLVLRDEGQDLLALGAAHPDVNVELVVPIEGGIAMRVHERGAGITDACGTGAVASAAAAHLWGMAGERMTVRQPGGDAEVDLSGDEATLTVPVVLIARVEVPCR